MGHRWARNVAKTLGTLARRGSLRPAALPGSRRACEERGVQDPVAVMPQATLPGAVQKQQCALPAVELFAGPRGSTAAELHAGGGRICPHAVRAVEYAERSRA